MSLDRRSLLSALSVAGAAALCPATGGEENGAEISAGSIAQAEKVAGLSFTEAERQLMLPGVRELAQDFAALHEVELPNQVEPALLFDPLPPGASPPPGPVVADLAGASPSLARPSDDDELAFCSAAELARLLGRGEVSSRQLTELYLSRLERFNPQLSCVVTLTRERALAEADRADRERRAGKLRGPLHGIPWGAKDLLAAAGYPTTWGSGPFREQRFEADSTVVSRLTEAGAVLVAKLTLGELAWGDVWFGGTTKNPWNLEQGSSGSSAGSAAATAAGLVGFSVGSETWGSIVSPSSRCGTTGLRPTFGRIPRTGAMALSWSMDKLGPICRSVEDCALVFAALAGPDGRDRTTRAAAFRWPPQGDPRKLRLGYVRSLFERSADAAAVDAAAEEEHALDLATLETFRILGFEPTPVELPRDLPIDKLAFILSAEAAAAFDELTRSGRDEQLVRQVEQAWPNVFRQARLIPAVEYLQANRVRTLLCQRMAELFANFDVLLTPSFGGNQLLLSNLTGHPALVFPNGFRKNGTPTSITLLGRLFEEEKLLAVGHLYQQGTDWHQRHPTLAPEAPLHSAS